VGHVRFKLVAFLTDFGLNDGFVATCHGVMLGINSDLTIVDVAHTVPPQDVQRGSLLLARVAPYLPPSVYVGVVDPGVGTERRGIAICTPGDVLIGPDNGLLINAAEALGGIVSAHEIRDERFFRHPVSATFHGRDVFAPCAAHVSRGTPLDQLGPNLPVDSLKRLPKPQTTQREDGFEAEVVFIDIYGNLHLSAPFSNIGTVDYNVSTSVRLESGKWAQNATLARTFGDVRPGELVFYEDAVGAATIAANCGNAYELSGVNRGDVVRVRRLPDPV
jgi:S-adenosyl-L-methionine hydrolase (adenosine-forming)